MGAHSSKGRKKKNNKKNRHPPLSPHRRDCHSVEPLTVAALIRVRGTEVERAEKRKERQRQSETPLESHFFFFKACYRNPSIDIQQFWGDCRLIT